MSEQGPLLVAVKTEEGAMSRERGCLEAGKGGETVSPRVSRRNAALLSTSIAGLLTSRIVS